MKRGLIKLIILESVALSVLLFNILFRKFIDEYQIVVFMGIIFGISVWICGFEREKVLYRKKVMTLVLFYTFAFLVFMYGLGLFIGYAKSPYSAAPIQVIKNLIPVLMLVFIDEMLRYNVLKKGGHSKILFVLSIILFTAVDVFLVIHMYNLKSVQKILELCTLVVVPGISKNYMLCDFARKYGYEPCLIYQVIMSEFVYIMPIIPSYGIYLDSVMYFIIPIVILYVINLTTQKEEKEDIRNKHIPEKIVSGMLATLIIVIVALCSNLFSYWIAVIGSGSMTPTINVGDAIIVDKHYQKHLERLKVGDILVFKIKDVIYTHRITNIQKANGKYSISTKGDRKGQADDTWRVTNNDVVGVVKQRIPYIGYPTVWLNRLMEERKK